MNLISARSYCGLPQREDMRAPNTAPFICVFPDAPPPQPVTLCDARKSFASMAALRSTK
jgi:hypothetical protein